MTARQVEFTGYGCLIRCSSLDLVTGVSMVDGMCGHIKHSHIYCQSLLGHYSKSACVRAVIGLHCKLIIIIKEMCKSLLSGAR